MSLMYNEKSVGRRKYNVILQNVNNNNNNNNELK